MFDISRRASGVVVALSIALATAGCAGRPFNVKVIPHVEPDAISAPSVSGPISLRAAAMWDEDWLFENFDANVVLAGVLPVRVEIENAGREPLDPTSLRIEAATGDGRALKVLDAKKARKIIEGYYGISIRGKNGDERYKADFAANAIDLRAALAAGEHRQGLLFVQLPKDQYGRQRVRIAFASKRAGTRAEALLE